jgi:hypothetical protein
MFSRMHIGYDGHEIIAYIYSTCTVGQGQGAYDCVYLASIGDWCTPDE